MSKRKQNLAIEQVMDELNEELGSLNTSPNLFSTELFVEPLESTTSQKEAEEQVGATVSIRADFSEKASLLPIEEQTTEEELSELDNLLSFEPNKNRYEEQNQIFPPPPQKENKKKAKKKEEKSQIFPPSPQKENKAQPIKEVKAPPLKKSLMQGAIGKMASLYDQTIEPGLSINFQQTENLRVAQERIVALEEEIDRLRKENEELISAGDIFRERLDKIAIQNDNLKKSYEESREEFQEEKKTLMNTIQDQSRELDKIELKNKELEKRLSNNIQQIRVRERELENRLELMKLDSQTLVREKDQYILDLKRQMDKLKMDLETQKNKSTETEQKLKGQKSQTRRATRGLQMALHILRGNDFSLEEIDTKEEKDIKEE